MADMDRARPAPFRGVLAGQPPGGVAEELAEPPFFADLNLDQVSAAVVKDRDGYRLAPFFRAPLRDAAAVRHRHAVIRELETEQVSSAMAAFARGMRDTREQLRLAAGLRYRYERERWFLDAASTYCGTVRALTENLARLDLASAGLRGFRGYLSGYTSSPGFTTLAREAERVTEGLAGVRYRVHIRGPAVRVSACAGEADYSAEVTAAFGKFRQGAVKDYRASYTETAGMDHVQTQITDRVALLFPGPFAALDTYCAAHAGFPDPVIGACDREIQFCLAYLGYIEPLRRAGLSFCYPDVSATDKQTRVVAGFDLALAAALVPAQRPVVVNSFQLRGPERLLVVTGPNQGGKTTFARMFGQLHYLASLGLPVPGEQARLFLPDAIFTHFERRENIETLQGKLADELSRAHTILTQATSSSVVIMNETFSSTTSQDALFLGREVMAKLGERGLLGVYVTFVDELASLSDATVSMVSTVEETNPAHRTYQILRRPADGLAYAAALAQKYRLDHSSVRARVRS